MIGWGGNRETPDVWFSGWLLDEGIIALARFFYWP